MDSNTQESDAYMNRFGKARRIFASMLLAAVMAFAFAGSALAADATQDLSIANPHQGSTYAVYQVMTAEQVGTDNEGNALYAYTVNQSFAGFFADGANGYTLDANNAILKNGEAVAGDARWTNANATEAAALASALERYAMANAIAPSATIVDDSAKTLPLGFYVVAETVSSENASGNDTAAREVATKPILVSLTASDAAAITLKDDTTSLDKNIVENGRKTKCNNASIGDDIDFELATKIPSYEANVDASKLVFRLTDTFSEGLTYNGDVAIEGFELGQDYTAAADGQTLTIAFTPSAIAANQGTPVTVTYSARLNESARVDSVVGNPNDVTLVYTNNTNEDESHKTLVDQTVTYSYGFNVHKVDKVAPSVGLADAKFELKDADGNKIVFKKVGDTYVVQHDATEGAAGTTTEIVSVGGEGLAAVAGLAEGVYTLTETQAPDEYTKLASDVTVTITAKRDLAGDETGEAILAAGGAGNARAEGGVDVVDSQGNKTGSVESTGNMIDISVYVENAKGISLPETGSATMLMCMAGGAAIVIAGGAYYLFGVRRRNRSHADDEA